MFKYSNGEISETLKPSNSTIKWTNGEKYEKTLISNDNNVNENNNNLSIENKMNDNTQTEIFSKEGLVQNGFVLKHTKRESFNDKLSERSYHAQVSQNPFLAGRTYSDDIEVEENFLRPKNTSSINVDQTILMS